MEHRMEVPSNFLVVEAGLYSVGVGIPEYCYPFLRSLKLRTIVIIDPGTPKKSLVELAAAENINIIHLVTESWRSNLETGLLHGTWMAFSEALKYALDARNYPLMVLGSELMHSLIRRLQNWTMSAVLNDYNSYSELSDIRVNSSGSSLLELTKLYYGRIEDAETIIGQESLKYPNCPVIIVDMPLEEYRPDWVRRFNIG